MDQRTYGKRDRCTGRREKRYAEGNDLSSEIWDFDDTCSKDLSVLRSEDLSGTGRNPYQLADQIQGIGFKIADEIATKIGIHSDSDFRIRSGIFYTLQQSVAEGHVYLTKDVLLRRASDFWKWRSRILRNT